MSPAAQPREIEFEAIFNFRDLGGYSAHHGRRVARGRVFRSGELRHATQTDLLRLREDVGLKSVLDLRGQDEVARFGLGPAVDFACYNVPLSTDVGNAAAVQRVQELGSTGAVYVLSSKDGTYGRRLVECLRTIAQASLPIVFHCSAGKDRTGVLAACVLSVLGVADADIVADYTLTGRHMAKHVARLSRNPEDARFLQSLPAWMHGAPAASMELFLSTMRRDYGSIREYLLSRGADEALFERLEEALLA